MELLELVAKVFETVVVAVAVTGTGAGADAEAESDADECAGVVAVVAVLAAGTVEVFEAVFVVC